MKKFLCIIGFHDLAFSWRPKPDERPFLLCCRCKKEW